MQILFVHQNFPGQYRYLAQYFAQRADCEVFAIGEKQNVQRQYPLIPKGITLLGYEMPKIDTTGIPGSSQHTVDHIVRAEAIASVLLRQKKLRENSGGFNPDVILAHPGWGEAFYLKEIFPNAKHIYFFEYFFSNADEILGFDSEFSVSLGKKCQYRLNNIGNLLALDIADVGVSPTRWQKSTYPQRYQTHIHEIHDGVDTQKVKPSDKDFVVFKTQKHGEVRISKEQEIISYSVRNLEPSRGFHCFMRALPEMQKIRPNATFVIVGGDEKSYSHTHPSGDTWREVMLSEVGDQLDFSRIIFAGKIPYTDLLTLFSITDLHIYLTTPFVLSWSLLEAMACEAPILASSTQPVHEVIDNGKNGFLFDFFSKDELLQQVERLMSDNELRTQAGRAARQSIVQRYDLHTQCLPKHLSLIGYK